MFLLDVKDHRDGCACLTAAHKIHIDLPCRTWLTMLYWRSRNWTTSEGKKASVLSIKYDPVPPKSVIWFCKALQHFSQPIVPACQSCIVQEQAIKNIYIKTSHRRHTNSLMKRGYVEEENVILKKQTAEIYELGIEMSKGSFKFGSYILVH